MGDRRELRKHFDYMLDGFFIRKASSNRWPKGLRVYGSMRLDGYLSIYFGGRVMLMHRAVFIWHFGKIENEIDHINGRRDDNRIENLRDVRRSDNICNLHKKPFNKHGVKGLSLKRGRWVGQVSINRKRYEVSSKEKSVAVQKLNELREKIHGDFARP